MCSRPTLTVSSSLPLRWVGLWALLLPCVKLCVATRHRLSFENSRIAVWFIKVPQVLTNVNQCCCVALQAYDYMKVQARGLAWASFALQLGWKPHQATVAAVLYCRSQSLKLVRGFSRELCASCSAEYPPSPCLAEALWRPTTTLFAHRRGLTTSASHQRCSLACSSRYTSTARSS